MSFKVSRLAVLLLAVLGTAGTTAALAHSRPGVLAHTQHPGALSGDWSGYIGSGSTRQRMQITVNARETAGTWRISASCHGALTLDSISGGYHHYNENQPNASV